MIPFLTLNKILVLVISATSAWIGFIAYRHNPKAKPNKMIVAMVALMLFWVDFAYLARMVNDSNPGLALVFLKIAWFVTPLFFALLYFLAIYLFSEKKDKSLLSYLVSFVAILLACGTGFTHLVITGTKIVKDYFTISYGVGMIAFLGGILFLIVAALYVPLRNYSYFSLTQKNRALYFLTGAFIFYTVNFIFNITLPIFFQITRYYWIADYSTVFLLGFVVYAVVKQKLFGLKIILTQLLIGSIALLLLADFISAGKSLTFFLKGILFVSFLSFGWLLTKSVQREIGQKEQIDRYATQLAITNKKLKDAYQKVKKLDKAKSEFIYIASHQLRTPLTAIKGYISMLLEGDYGKIQSQGQKKVVENVFSANERIIALVNSLLNLSRLESGKIKINKEKVNLEELLEQIVKDFQQQASNKNLALSFEKPKVKIKEIEIDREKIREVVSNLIDNALKYTPTGTIKVKLDKIKKKGRGEFVLVSVVDTGEGMGKEEIAKLFNSFSRAKAGTKHWVSGTGLGLYIAKKFVLMHQGHIKAISEGKGKGSKFCIELPIK